MLVRAAIAGSLLALAGATPATAGVFTSYGGVTAPKGIVRAPDGTYWIAERTQVTQIGAADGKIGRHVVFATPDTHPAKLAAGQYGDIWGTSDTKLFHFDPAAPTGTVVTEVAPLSPCATEGIYAGFQTDVFYTAPACGTVGFVSLTSLPAPYDIMQKEVSIGGAAHAVVGALGKIWAPVPSRGSVVRATLDNLGSVEVETAVAGGPTGIVGSVGNDLLVTTAGGTFAEVQSTAGGGNDPGTSVFTPPFATGPLSDVTGANGGGYYVISTGTSPLEPGGKVVWMNYDGRSFSAAELPGGGVPGGIAPAPDGAWITDTLNNRVLHFVDGPPRVSTLEGTKASVDPIGNDTSVWLEYGTTARYGATTAAVSATGSGSREAGFSLSGLAPGTTYHYRARASSVRGASSGEDRTFTTAPAPPPPPPIVQPQRLSARLSVARRSARGRTRLTRLRVTGLLGGEAILIRCTGTGKGCPFTRRTVVATRPGTLDLTAKVRNARFKTGAKLTFTISKPGYLTITRRVRPRPGS